MLDQAPPAPLPESVPDFLRVSPQPLSVIGAELFLDGGRQVTGEIRLAGVGRRLVDLLNALDNNGYLTMHEGTLREGSGSCLQFDLIQLTRSSILLAFPDMGSTSRIDPGEVIEKHRRLVTVIMPGCQVSGYFHAALGVDPSLATRELRQPLCGPNGCDDNGYKQRRTNPLRIGGAIKRRSRPGLCLVRRGPHVIARTGSDGAGRDRTGKVTRRVTTEQVCSAGKAGNQTATISSVG